MVRCLSQDPPTVVAQLCVGIGIPNRHLVVRPESLPTGGASEHQASPIESANFPDGTRLTGMLAETTPAQGFSFSPAIAVTYG